MRLLVTGASGLVGRHLVAHAIDRGDEVFAASRNPDQHQWPTGVTAVQWPGGALPQVDAVVHLAGASIGGRRWSRRYMQEIHRSRVETARELAQSLPADTALICASAVGYYGRAPRGACPVDRGAGDDFLAQLCVAWENAAKGARGRVVRVRFGHVLARHDGLLGRLETLHKARAAGIVGSGDQSLPWIHVKDLAALLHTLAGNAAHGPVNGNVGNVSYKQLHEAMCDRVGGFKSLRIPTLALKIRLGKFAPFLLGGQEVVPGKVDGWAPMFKTFEQAMDDLYPS